MFKWTCLGLSLVLAACAAESAAVAPASSSGVIASRRRAHTVTACPCFKRLRTIGAPIVPRPMNPIVFAIGLIVR